MPRLALSWLLFFSVADLIETKEDERGEIKRQTNWKFTLRKENNRRNGLMDGVLCVYLCVFYSCGGPILEKHKRHPTHRETKRGDISTVPVLLFFTVQDSLLEWLPLHPSIPPEKIKYSEHSSQWTKRKRNKIKKIQTISEKWQVFHKSYWFEIKFWSPVNQRNGLEGKRTSIEVDKFENFLSTEIDLGKTNKLYIYITWQGCNCRLNWK